MDCSMGMATILPSAKRADQGRILLGYFYCMNGMLIDLPLGLERLGYDSGVPKLPDPVLVHAVEVDLVERRL
jgi:hypothetical protein